MSLPPSVALELNGKPLVVRNTFIDEVHEVPTFRKLNTAPGACEGSTTTADLLEHAVHDEPLCHWRCRALNTARVVNTDACSCGDVMMHSISDASDMASTASEIFSPVNVC